VQVREDFAGDFEVRARVTNNGAATDFAFMEATVFASGKVATVGEAAEEFDAGETRTVTFISTDNYSAWDEVEFTVDRG